MGSIYPHFEGTRWDRLGYDSYDLDKHIQPIVANTFKYVVRQGKLRVKVLAHDIESAKRKACEARGDFVYEQITEVRALRLGANDLEARKVLEHSAMIRERMKRHVAAIKV